MMDFLGGRFTYSFEIIVCLQEKKSNWLVIRVLSLIPVKLQHNIRNKVCDGKF